MGYYSQKVEALTNLNHAQGRLIWLLFALVVLLLILVILQSDQLIQNLDEVSRLVLGLIS